MNFQKYLIVLAGILVILVVGLNLYLLKAQNKAVTKPTPLPVAKTQAKVDNLESCDLKREGNPLVADVRALTDSTIVGNFRGNINKVEAIEGGSAIEVVSPRGEQTHTFKVKSEEGLVYDATVQKDLTLGDLEPGQSVTISFNCFPEKNNLFKITRIAITGRLK